MWILVIIYRHRLRKIGVSILYIHCGYNKYATQLFLHLILINLVFTQLLGPFNFV